MERLIAIDFARGIAVLLMIFCHIGMFTNITLKNMGSQKIPGYTTMYGMNPVFTIMGIIAHTMFLILVGVNMVSSYNKPMISPNVNADVKQKKKFILRNLKRAGTIFGLGIIMSIITRLVFGKWVIIFGIFQFIAFAIVLAIPFTMLSAGKSAIGFLVILAITSIVSILKIDNQAAGFDVSGFINIAIGLNRNVFLDYFPILPYFAYVLAGVFLGKIIYNTKSINQTISDLNKKNNGSTKFVSEIGRNSIKLYFIHLVVIFVVMKIVLRNNSYKIRIA